MPDFSIRNYLPGGDGGNITRLAVNAGGISIQVESFVRQRQQDWQYSWDKMRRIKTIKDLFGDIRVETSIGCFGGTEIYTFDLTALHVALVFYSFLASSSTGSGMPIIEFDGKLLPIIDKYKSDEMPWHEFIDHPGRPSIVLREIAQAKEGHKYIKEWLDTSPCATKGVGNGNTDNCDNLVVELRKIENLAEKGLISEEEKRLMRKRVLGI